MAQNLDTGNEGALKLEIQSPSTNPDTTNNASSSWGPNAQFISSPRSAAPSEISDNGVDTTADIHSKKFSFDTIPSPNVRSTPATSTQEMCEVSPVEAPTPMVQQVAQAAVSTSSMASINVLSPNSQVSQEVVSHVPAEVQMTPIQRRLQQQLLQKHKLLQEAIMRQQQELRAISEQLNLSYDGSQPSTPAPAAPGTPILMDSSNMPVVCIPAPLESSDQLQQLATSSIALPGQQAAAMAPLMSIPMVLGPQQVLLNMPAGTLITSTSIPTLTSLTTTTGQPHCSSSNLTDNNPGGGGPLHK